MKHLWLVRHGQALGYGSAEHDRDRLLSEKGVADIRNLARYLDKRGVQPDLIQTSSAVRAAGTARLLVEGEGASALSMQEESALYMATPTDLWDAIRGTAQDVNTLFVVAHNPGLSELASECAERMVALAPGDCAYIVFACDDWTHASEDNVTSIEVVTARTVARS